MIHGPRRHSLHPKRKRFDFVILVSNNDMLLIWFAITATLTYCVLLAVVHPQGALWNSNYSLYHSRVCGSPAIDGYARVNETCLRQSPTATLYTKGKDPTITARIDRFADYDGIAVKWGIDNKVSSVEECAEQCMSFNKMVEGDTLPCTAFVYCDAPVCFEPDAHHHTQGDCWLKFSEAPASPEVNMRGRLPPDMRARHPEAPIACPWHAGVLLPRNIRLTNGTFSPRSEW